MSQIELNIINSDPYLIKTLVHYLEVIGITKEKLKVTLRLYSDLNKNTALNF